VCFTLSLKPSAFHSIGLVRVCLHLMSHHLCHQSSSAPSVFHSKPSASQILWKCWQSYCHRLYQRNTILAPSVMFVVWILCWLCRLDFTFSFYVCWLLCNFILIQLPGAEVPMMCWCAIKKLLTSQILPKHRHLSLPSFLSTAFTHIASRKCNPRRHTLQKFRSLSSPFMLTLSHVARDRGDADGLLFDSI